MRIHLVFLALTIVLAKPSRAQSPPLLAAAKEIALAESAAPPALAREAAVYVLTGDGYVQARAGTNGFACLVERSHPASLEPICWDAEGTATVLPRVLEAAALRAAGLDEEAVDAAIAEGYRSGRFRAPRRTGIAYMLSEETRFVDPSTGWVEPGVPHLMFYAPYLTNADLGSAGEAAAAGPAAPFVIAEGTPEAYVVVLVGAPAPAGGPSAAGGAR